MPVIVSGPGMKDRVGLEVIYTGSMPRWSRVVAKSDVIASHKQSPLLTPDVKRLHYEIQTVANSDCPGIAHGPAGDSGNPSISLDWPGY